MICDKCKHNEASVLIQQNLNGNITEFNLCAECAASTASNMTFDTILKNFMNSVMGISTSFQEKGNEQFYQKLQCPECGLTYEGFKSLGKLGCSDCYNAFRKQLLTLFKNIHGSAVHTGKLPLNSGAQLIKAREVESLKKQLKQLIESEEFEEAAKIRDKIKELSQ